MNGSGNSAEDVEGMSSEGLISVAAVVQERLKGLLETFEAAGQQMMGYPTNQDFDYSEMLPVPAIQCQQRQRPVSRQQNTSRVPGSGVGGRGSGERETTGSSLAGKEESSRKEDNGGQGKEWTCWSCCARGEWTVTWTSCGRH